MNEVTRQDITQELEYLKAYANKWSKWSKTKTKQNDFVDIDFLNESGKVIYKGNARFKNAVDFAWNYISENKGIAEVKIHLVGGNRVGFKIAPAVYDYLDRNKVA